MSLNNILSFTGDFRFLSNCYPVEVEFESIIYPSSEHAYMAAKTLDLDLRLQIRDLTSPGKAKRVGRALILRPNWELMKVQVMRTILEDKFSRLRTDPPLFQMLKDTAPLKLVEGNTWGDTFWGECPVGTGRNELGKLLMTIRDDITERTF